MTVERKTEWGLPIKDFYSADDIKGIDYAKDLNDPGGFPYARGTHRGGYRTKDWGKKMTVGFGLPSDTNKRFKYLRSRGEVGGMTVVEDKGSDMTIDSDHPLARKEAGLVGVVLNSVSDMEELLDGLDISNISFQKSPMGGPVVLAQIIVYAQNHGVDPRTLRGSIIDGPYESVFGQEDPQPLSLAWKLFIDVIEYCARNRLNYHYAPAQGHHLGESGITIPCQVGILMASLREVSDAVIDRGLGIDDFAPRYYSTASLGIRFFEEIAKIRAQRRMWARMAKERYGAKDPRSCFINVPIKLSGASLTYRQPLNNIARGAIECLAAALAGTTAIELSAYDEPHCEPTEVSSRIALNTQHIIAKETGIADTTDPLGGSYYIEYLSNKIEEEAWKVFDEVESRGGLLAAIEQGWYHKLWDQTVYEKQSALDKKERILVGVNELVIPPEEEEQIDVHEVPPEVSETIVNRLIDFKASRDTKKLVDALERLYHDAKKGEKFNLMPSIIEATRYLATRGEIFGVIRMANGLAYDPFNMIESPFRFS